MEQIRYDRDLLSIPELAREAGMSEGFWRKMIWQRKIEYAKVGRAVRVSRRAFDAYLAARRVQPVERIAA
jgi:excisionase family DNA binding protein